MLIYSNKGDTLFFTYSGHGSYTLDQNNEEADGKDELLVCLDLAGIRDDELKDIINKYLKEDVTLFVLFDCCHSGTLIDLKYNYLNTNNYNEVLVNTRNLETKGNVYLISGCRDDQTSADAYINRNFQGAMTWSFLQSVNKNITWKQLLLNMRGKLKQHYTQVPQFSSGKECDINTKICI